MVLILYPTPQHINLKLKQNTTKPSHKTLSETARLQTPSLRSLGCKEAWLDTRIIEDFLDFGTHAPMSLYLHNMKGKSNVQMFLLLLLCRGLFAGKKNVYILDRSLISGSCFFRFFCVLFSHVVSQRNFCSSDSLSWVE